MNKNDLIRFLAKVDKRTNAPCWIWTASKFPQGYGQFTLKRSDGSWRSTNAHRVSYMHWKGEIPNGFEVDHLCRVRACVNPKHLEVVTGRTNILRGKSPAAKAAKATHCIRGHEFSMENTYLIKTGGRMCRLCTHIRKKQYKLADPERYRRYNKTTYERNKSRSAPVLPTED